MKGLFFTDRLDYGLAELVPQLRAFQRLILLIGDVKHILRPSPYGRDLCIMETYVKLFECLADFGQKARTVGRNEFEHCIAVL